MTVDAMQYYDGRKIGDLAYSQQVIITRRHEDQNFLPGSIKQSYNPVVRKKNTSLTYIVREVFLLLAPVFGVQFIFKEVVNNQATFMRYCLDPKPLVSLLSCRACCGAFAAFNRL